MSYLNLQGMSGTVALKMINIFSIPLTCLRGSSQPKRDEYCRVLIPAYFAGYTANISA